MTGPPTETLWLVASGDHECGSHIAVYSTRSAAERTVRELNAQMAPDSIDHVHLQELPLDPPRVGYWRYWIIDGEPDDAMFCVLPLTDERWPAYDMTSSDNALGWRIVGACGLGWTREEARAAAVRHREGTQHMRAGA